MKAKLSTKMIGETLEQHCETEFNKLRATAFQNAYFEKDKQSAIQIAVAKVREALQEQLAQKETALIP